MVRRPVVNLGSEDTYYNNSKTSLYNFEEDLKEDKERSKKFCELCSVLLVFNAKEQAFICPKCGVNPQNLDTENTIKIAKQEQPIEEHEQSESETDFIIETASHYRSPNPGAKSNQPIINDYSDEAMRFRPVGNEATSRAAQSRNRFNVDDPDITRLQEMYGATIVSYDEITDSKGTLSGEELERQRQERIRQRHRQTR